MIRCYIAFVPRSVFQCLSKGNRIGLSESKPIAYRVPCHIPMWQLFSGFILDECQKYQTILFILNTVWLNILADNLEDRCIPFREHEFSINVYMVLHPLGSPVSVRGFKRTLTSNPPVHTVLPEDT